VVQSATARGARSDVRVRLQARGGSAVGLPVPEWNEDLLEFYRLGSGLCLMRDGKKRDVYNVIRAHQLLLPGGA